MNQTRVFIDQWQFLFHWGILKPQRSNDRKWTHFVRGQSTNDPGCKRHWWVQRKGVTKKVDGNLTSWWNKTDNCMLTANIYSFFKCLLPGKKSAPKKSSTPIFRKEKCSVNHLWSTSVDLQILIEHPIYSSVRALTCFNWLLSNVGHFNCQPRN